MRILRKPFSPAHEVASKDRRSQAHYGCTYRTTLSPPRPQVHVIPKREDLLQLQHQEIRLEKALRCSPSACEAEARPVLHPRSREGQAIRAVLQGSDSFDIGTNAIRFRAHCPIEDHVLIVIQRYANLSNTYHTVHTEVQCKSSFV